MARERVDDKEVIDRESYRRVKKAAFDRGYRQAQVDGVDQGVDLRRHARRIIEGFGEHERPIVERFMKRLLALQEHQHEFGGGVQEVRSQGTVVGVRRVCSICNYVEDDEATRSAQGRQAQDATRQRPQGQRGPDATNDERE